MTVRCVSMKTGGPEAFRAALLAVPGRERDAWVDVMLGIDDIPADSSELPTACVPYLPCSVEALLAIVDGAGITSDDVVVDIGAGVGRALAIVQRLTGAVGIGIEVQSALVARALAEVEIRHADVDAIELPVGSVYLLYCPFSGARLHRLLDRLARMVRPIRVACVDLPLPACDWLTLRAEAGGVATYENLIVR
jgi:SAM-dependent methyltransferase